MERCPRCDAAERRQKAAIRWWLSLALIAVVVVVVWVALQPH
jgi:predicted nucleic acid-binding Zn ribbon protein